jgi:two-component system, OmpR family, KDP operon response regulator KdpE
VVQDDRQIRCLLRSTLAGGGFQVWEAETLQRGIIDAGTRRPDLVIVDPALPDGHGHELIREVRSFSCVPILVLSARVDEIDKIAALDLGADDYLTKPFGVGELLARTRALLRRNARCRERGSTVYEFARVRVDLEDRRVTRAAAPVHLTSVEFRLLAYLVNREGKLLTHRELLREVWGPRHVDHSHYLRIYIAQLRQKLEDEPARPRHFVTEIGAGYRFLGSNDRTSQDVTPAGRPLRMQLTGRSGGSAGAR